MVQAYFEKYPIQLSDNHGFDQSIVFDNGHDQLCPYTGGAIGLSRGVSHDTDVEKASLA